MSVVGDQTPLVALLHVGWESDTWHTPLNTNAFRWHMVKAGPPRQQVRELWISEAMAAVLLIGPGEAINHAIDLLHLLHGTGPPILMAIADPHDAETERLLRQTGAIYLCGPEAQHRLIDILREVLCKPGVI